MANFFPRWTNWIPIKLIVCAIVIAWRLDRGHVVLRHAEVYQSRIPTDPAGAVSARYSRDTTRYGLSLLSQLRGSRRAIQCAEHADVHELPHASGKGQSKAPTGAG